jgi:hypothetical protein
MRCTRNLTITKQKQKQKQKQNKSNTRTWRFPTYQHRGPDLARSGDANAADAATAVFVVIIVTIIIITVVVVVVVVIVDGGVCEWNEYSRLQIRPVTTHAEPQCSHRRRRRRRQRRRGSALQSVESTRCCV